MTEAAHQMASNPLPPRAAQAGQRRRRRRAGGRDHGRRTARCSPPATVGEIVIRGPNVTAGYENNPEANATAFADGWFRTGDQGTMDAEGYLRDHRPAQGDHQPRRREDLAARGRRGADGPSGGRPGGHLRHAARQARRGGRRGGRAARGQAATEREIRDFAASRLADFKVPRKVVILDEIPKGATGKLQRIGLAAEARPRLMRICIFGAGAIGGFLAAKLAAGGGADLSLVARGPHLAAMRDDGLTLDRGRAPSSTCRSRATRPTPAELGAQDYVILTLKAHSVAGALDAIAPLLGPETAVVTAQNGVPWWYFYGIGGPLRGPAARQRSIRAACIWDGIGPERVIGCVVYPAAEVEAPGVIRHVEGDRFPLGEPSGEKTRARRARSPRR